MNHKLYELVDIHSGVVLSRKEASPEGTHAIRYMRLTLRALSDAGILQQSELEPFYSREQLDQTLLTSLNDVIVRLSTPINPVLIGDGQEGLLMPSQIAAIRVKENTPVLPGFLRWFLSQKSILDALQAAEHGTAQRTIKVKSLLDLDICVPSLLVQSQVLRIDALSRRREQLYQELIVQERLHAEQIIDNIMEGVKQ